MTRGDFIEACRAGDHVIVSGGSCLKFARSKWVPSSAKRKQLFLRYAALAFGSAAILALALQSFGYAALLCFLAATIFLYSRAHAAKALFQKAMRDDTFFTAMEFPGLIRLESGGSPKRPSEFRFGKRDFPLLLNYSSLQSFYIKRADGSVLRGVKAKED